MFYGVIEFIGSESGPRALSQRVDDPMQRRTCMDKLKRPLAQEAKVYHKEGQRRTMALSTNR